MTTAIMAEYRRPTLADRKESARLFIAEHPNCGVAEVTAHLGIEKTYTRLILSKMADEGHIVRVRHGAYVVADVGRPVPGAVEQAAATGDRRTLLEAVLIRLAQQADRTTRDAGLAALARQVLAVSAELERLGGAAGELPILVEMAERRQRRVLAGDPVVEPATHRRLSA